jgi:2-polyprenyl-3-methyl-5-hydroxy-6-metoxy-1,4-benzoquinol methylase
MARGAEPTRTLGEVLRTRYLELQGRRATPAVYADIRSAWAGYDANYRDLVEPLPRDTRILEVGAGHGSLIAWLRSLAFEEVEGVDSSPGDVEFANSHLGDGVVTLGGAQSHLERRCAEYGLVVMKAVLEHVPKQHLLPLVEAAARALRPGGMLLVEVPNMDWLLAGHERYMDLTHEVGFTRESLTSLLSIVFREVSVRGSNLAAPTRSQRWLRRPLLAVLHRTLYVLGEGASDVLFAHRSLVGVASDPRTRGA